MSLDCVVHEGTMSQIQFLFVLHFLSYLGLLHQPSKEFVEFVHVFEIKTLFPRLLTVSFFSCIIPSSLILAL